MWAFLAGKALVAERARRFVRHVLRLALRLVAVMAQHAKEVLGIMRMQ